MTEIGFDLWHTLEPASGVNFAQVKKQFGHKMTFVGAVDASRILPFGTPKDVEKAVERVHANLWNNGGCLAQFEWTAETSLANAEAVYATWDRLTKTA
jgi:uroporphyrinogen-III decarboxylase